MSLTIGIFGIHNSTANLVVDLVLLFLVVLWVALVYWTFADARRRIDDPMLIGCATVAALFPFLGTVVYTIVRPPEYLDDVHERDLEIQAAQARLDANEFHACPHCDKPVGRDFLRCPYCLRKLRMSCESCNKPLDPDWRICPYCETEIPGVTPPKRPRRRRQAAAAPAATSPAAATKSGGSAAAAPPRSDRV